MAPKSEGGAEAGHAVPLPLTVVTTVLVAGLAVAEGLERSRSVRLAAAVAIRCETILSGTVAEQYWQTVVVWVTVTLARILVHRIRGVKNVMMADEKNIWKD